MCQTSLPSVSLSCPGSQWLLDTIACPSTHPNSMLIPISAVSSQRLLRCQHTFPAGWRCVTFHDECLSSVPCSLEQCHCTSFSWYLKVSRKNILRITRDWEFSDIRSKAEIISKFWILNCCHFLRTTVFYNGHKNKSHKIIVTWSFFNGEQQEFRIHPASVH